MALVNYSDSEDSDTETRSARAPAPAPAPPTLAKTVAKSTFQKVVDRTEPRKIKVDLPAFQPEGNQQNNEERPAKKARTAGAFSGFNSLLPAPKRAAATNGPKPGVSLKTSSEAAFSRVPAMATGLGEEQDEGTNGGGSGGAGGNIDGEAGGTGDKAEPKIVGKATRFKPLSVGNKKKPMKKAKAIEGDKVRDDSNPDYSITQNRKQAEGPISPRSKPKRSLFSVPQDEQLPSETISRTYESLSTQFETPKEPINSVQQPTQPLPTDPNPNSLQSLASGLDLTPAQRRQIFGRRSTQNQTPNMNIAHFNMDAEYASNEQLRQAGEVVEHRAVKAIAPGKHSLQQLVNNARSQQDAMEDKWADGRRDRGEGGARYGWGK